MINSDWWMVLDVESPKLDRLYIYGALELENGRDHKLTANLIMLTGLNAMLIVGWPDKPMLNNVLISLTGDHDTKDLPLPGGPNLGAKALGIFARAQLIGKPYNVRWTRLAQTLEKGGTSITLEDEVYDWEIGNEIIISTTTFAPEQAEKFTIKDISEDGKTLTIEPAAKFVHSASTFSTNGYSYTMSAKVGLLTRTIVIEGADDPARVLDDQSFGCRVLVGKYDGLGSGPGKAQFSDVQFKNCGQYGWNERYDPREVKCRN